MESTQDRIAVNLRKGILEYGVLALLSRREMYGLELVDELMKRELIAGEGSLYPLLARMRENGLVQPTLQSSPAGRPRRYYAVTSEGSAQLRSFATIWRELVPHVDALLKEPS